jgi:hypothetical protein
MQLPSGQPATPMIDPDTGEPAVAPGSAQEPADAPGSPGSDPAQAPGGSVGPSGIVDDPAECAQENGAKKPHDHHIYPQMFRDDFLRIKIQIDNFTITIPADQHIGPNGVHTVFDWNGQWEDFFSEMPDGPLSKEAAQKWQTKARALATELLNDAGMAGLPIHPWGSL